MERPLNQAELASADFRLPSLPAMGLLGGGAAALIGAIACLLMADDRASMLVHAKFAYLTGFMYCLSIGLGALFFTLLHHLANARWSVVVRRISEAIAMNLWWMLIAVIPIFFWMPDLFPWMRPEVQHLEAVAKKLPYLNKPFFIIRTGFYFFIWLLLTTLFYWRSLKQDQTGDVAISVRLRKIAAPGMVLFALTLTFAAFDYMMSLDPKWYSTIFGVYYFAGAYLGFMALLILISTHLRIKGYVPVISEEHFHDMGKYLFAWVVFWTYIAFSQLLLIWMANIPEETIFYTHRWKAEGWRTISWLLVFGHFIVPFLFLLPRTIKRNKLGLGAGAVWLLVMHFVDLYWIIMPNFQNETRPSMVLDVLLWLAMFCGFTFLAYMRMRTKPLIPLRDPYLADSIAFENF